MTIKLQRYLIISLAALLLCPVLCATPARADLAPTWQYELPGGGGEDNFDGAILGMYTEPGHPLLYVWTFDGDVYAFNQSGSVVWKGFMEDDYYTPAINPNGDLWLIGTDRIKAYSLKGEVLIDKPIVKTPPQKQTKRAVVTTMSPDFDAVYGLNIDGDFVWAVHELGDYQNIMKNNVNPGMYFLIDTMNDDDTQIFYGLSPWSDIEWAYDTSDYAEMPVYGVSAQLRRDGSVVMAEAYGADMLIDGYGEPGRLFSVSSKGEFEWEYPEEVCLVSNDSTDNGSVFVVTPEFALRAISRKGNDLWDVIYDDTDSLLYCHPAAGSSAVVHFWAYIPDTNDLYADYVARVASNGDVVGEAWLEDPVNYYGYSVMFGDTYVVTDGEYALRAFDF